MGSGIFRDITPAMVYELEYEKGKGESYSAERWHRLKEERKMFANFILSRLRTAFPDQADTQATALGVIVEIISMDERAAFVEHLQREFNGLAPVLGNAALSEINPDSVVYAYSDESEAA